jgi:hypothetical protein
MGGESPGLSEANMIRVNMMVIVMCWRSVPQGCSSDAMFSMSSADLIRNSHYSAMI